MRHLLPLSLLAVLAACGSSLPTDGTPPPPPNSPAPAAPASVTVSTGDGQQALPGSLLPISPAVIVKDGSGTPVSGVTVTFAVDSGGGSITGATATTGSTGIATVGGWTLGTAEGRNVLRATVGTLAPVRITAMATTAATVTYPAMSIGAGGGAISIAQAGPLNGFNLTLPPAAFTAATQWTVSYSANTAVPRTAGINPITPLIDIASSVGNYASSFMTLTIPATVPAGLVPFIVLRDPTSGTMEVLATTVVSPGMVTAATAHLNGAHLVSAARTGSLRHAASLRGSDDIQAFVTALTPDQLAADYDTGFRPGTDDWATQSIGTYPAPDGICSGLTITAMWYYINQKQNVGQLYGRFALAPGVYTSVKVGLDWGTAVQLQLESNDFKALNDYIDQVVRAGNVGARDQNFLNILKAQLLITRAPQFMVTARTIKDKFAHAVIAWKTVGNTIYVADPNFPGDATHTILFDGTRFAPYEAPEKKDGPVISYPFISTIGLSQLIPLDLLNDQWPSVADSSIGRNLFPSYSFKSKYGTFPSDTVWLSDTLRIWYECPSCQPLVTSPAVPEAVGSLTLNDEYVLSTQSATWVAAGANFLVAGENAFTQTRGTHYTLADDIYGPFMLNGAQANAWLDWHQFIRDKVNFSIAPKPDTGFVGVPLHMTSSFADHAPAHLVYGWDFGDSTDKQTFTDNPAATHTYTGVGTYTVVVQVLDARTQQMITADTTTATIKVSDYAWQLTSVTLTSSSLPPGGIGPLPSDTAVKKLFDSWVPNLQGSPTSWLFYLANVTPGPCRSLFLEQFPAGQFAPIIDSTGDDLRAFFASNCNNAPYYVTTLTFGTPGSGVLTGTAAPGSPPNNVTVLPGGSINATMNGTTLQGTFTWPAAYSNGNGIYVFTFTATRVLPVP